MRLSLYIRRGSLAGVLWLPCALMASSCSPPPGFRDTPPPAIAPAGDLAAHTETIVIPRPLLVVRAAMNEPLSNAIRRSDSLPGVAGEFVLTGGSFGMPGSRRMVCLTDGSSTEEEVLEREDGPRAGHFRYVVWNYTTPKARPILYGVGEFRTVAIDAGHTRVTWTYAFQLRGDRFPGELGALGRWLFEVGFLDRDYASMMKSVLQGYADNAEKQPAIAPLRSR
ncbi:MAG: SRPBCC family protein [Acidobacteriaceae bacterium]